MLLEENPSLKRYLPKTLEESYFTTRLNAIAETGLEDDVFPESCPWQIKSVLNT